MIGRTSNGESKYIDDTTQAGVTYWYVVRASDGIYLSIDSPPVSAYSFNNFAPQPPKNVAAYTGSIDKTVNVWWVANEEEDLAGYKIYYGSASRTYGKPVVTGLMNYNMLTGLVNDTVYYISITAHDTDGNESLHSQEVMVMPKDEDIEPPSFSEFYPVEVTEGVDFYIRCNISDLSGVYDDSSGADGQGVYLVWDNDGELLESSYEVQMSQLPSDTYITDVSIPGQSVAAQFVYQVYACDNDYDWSVADDRSRGASPEQTMSFLKTPSMAYNYPNPAPSAGYGDRTIFRYYTASDADVRIDIYSIAGNMVANLEDRAIGGKYNEIEWDISDIASGVYLYVLEIQPASGFKQVIKKKLAIVR